MDPDKILGDLSSELSKALRGMSKAKTVEEKVAYSEVVKNVSEALGVFLNFATNMMDFDPDEDDDF